MCNPWDKTVKNNSCGATQIDGNPPAFTIQYMARLCNRCETRRLLLSLRFSVALISPFMQGFPAELPPPSAL